MTILSTTQKNTATNTHDELILVVKRAIIMPESWHGLRTADHQEYAQKIIDHQEFHPRSIMETDSTYKQIIPYIIFCHNDRYFLMQRRSTASETRLQNKYTLGIGGHIRQEDIKSADIVGWAHREFHEEVAYQGSIKWQFLGLLNDDTNAVGQVHLGFVLLAHGDSDTIAIKSELKHGSLLSLDACKTYYDSMETWSQVIVHHLIS